MGNNGGMIAFFAIAFTVIFGGFIFFYIQFLPPAQSAVKCTSDELSISFLIDDDKRIVIMDGKELSSEVINAFNKTTISAQWDYKKVATKLFLDRVAGLLEIDTKESGSLDWDKDTLECVNASARF